MNLKIAAAAALLAGATLSLNAIAHEGKLTVTRQVTVDAPAASVWKYVGNFNALDVWHPAVAKSELTKGSGMKAGDIRVLTLGDGAQITEKLVNLDNGKRSYAYTIEKGPLPVKNYRSMLQVAEKDGKTVVTWSSTFDANGAPDEKAAEVIGGVYDGGLARVVNNFKK